MLEEEEYLYDNKSHIYIARDAFGNIIGCIRSFHWDKHKILPIEKIYGINPLNAIHQESKYSFWHIGRFAVAKDSGISTLTLFKRLMALAVKPIVEDKYSYMIAEIDSKLLNEGVGNWHTSDRKIHRLPYIRDHSCVFQQKRYYGLLFQVW